MSGLMAPSVVFRTGLRGFMLTMLTWVNEVTVVFAQIGDDSVIEKATTQATEKVVEKVTEKTMSLADWKILWFETVVAPYSPIKEIHTPAFAFQFQAKRYVGYYLWEVLLPLAVVVIMSWSAFWVGREHMGVRIAVATSSILTLIAHRFVLASLLPRLPYMTRLDYFTVGSTLLVLLALITVIVTGYLAAHSQERHARRIDLLARGTFPGAFLLLLLWFMVG